MTSTATPAEQRERMIRENVPDILEHARDLDPDELVLVLDTRDDFGADLAAQLDMPAGLAPAAKAESSYLAARSAVDKEAQRLAEAGLEPIRIATVRRPAMVRALRAADLEPLADDLEDDPARRVVAVAADGATLANLPSGADA